MTGLHGLKAAALLSALLIITAVFIASDATAQRGRAEVGRRASKAQVERRDAVRKKANSKRKTPVARVKVAERQKVAQRARSVQRKSGSSGTRRVRGTERTGRTGNDGVRIEDRTRKNRGGKGVGRTRNRSSVDGNRNRRSGELNRKGRGSRSGDALRKGRGSRSGEVNRKSRGSRTDDGYRDGRNRRGDRANDGYRDGRNRRGDRTYDRYRNRRDGQSGTRYRSDRNRVKGSRPRFDGRNGRRHRPVIVPHKYKYGKHYRHNRRHKHQYGWCSVYHPAGHHHYVNAHIHIGSHISIGVAWPWQVRYQRHWRPRYRYRQVVYVNAGWGGQRRAARVDVRTYYRHRVLHADDRYAEVEVEIDAIEVYQNDRFLGTVDQIPGSLRKIRATISADGRIDFDRNVFLIGDARSGFELISTRHYDDYLHNAYDERHGYRVGRVDLRSGKVRKVHHSRHFDYRQFNGFVPISLLPDDERMWDYGRPYLEESSYDDYEGNGWYRRYRDSDLSNYEDDGYQLSRDVEVSYTTPQGGQVRLQRSSRLERLD